MIFALSRDRIQSKIGTLSLVALILPIIAAVFLPRVLAFAPALSLLLILADRLKNRQPRPALLTEPVLWLLAITALALVSSLWAIDPNATAHRALRAAFVLLTGGVLIDLVRVTPAGGQFRILLLPVFYALSTLVLAVDIYLHMPVYKFAHEFSESIAINPSLENRGVILCTLLYIPMLALIFVPGAADRRRRILLSAIITVPLLLVLYKTESQSSQLALVLGLLCMGVFPYRWRPAWYALGFGLIAAVLAAPWLGIWMFHYLSTELAASPFFGTGHGYAGNRLEIWDFVSRYALRRPLIGFGMESTRDVQAFDSKQIYQQSLTILHPHNFAIQLWMEFGVIGAVFGAALLARLLWFISRLNPVHQRFALPTLAMCLSTGAMTYGLWQGWWLGLLVFIIALTVLTAGFFTDRAEYAEMPGV